MKLVLASKSPRRKELLRLAGIHCRIIAKEVEEIFPADMPVSQVPEYLAVLKAKAVLPEIDEDEIILAADTIVVKGGKIFGKPKDRADAIHILKELSGNVHEVISGVCLLNHQKQKTFSEITRVFFNPLTEKEITEYVDEFQPFDKAGAYAIQEKIGLIGIQRIDGCYANVVGLPVSRVYKELNKF